MKEMDFIFERQRIAWQRGLDVLKPTQSQLEHGLELHENMFVTDHFGFLPRSFRNKSYAEKFNKLMSQGVGARELSKQMAYQLYECTCNDENYPDVFRRAMRNSGLNCIVHTVAEGKSREEDIKRMACNLMLFRKFRDTMAQAGSADDILEINKEGKIAVVFSVNGPPIVGELQELEQELHWIDDWRRLGVRLMHLSYNRRNFIADGCAERSDAGLSDLGLELIKRLNESGIIVDVPHTGKRSSIEADETLRAIADTDGMVGVYAYAGLLGGDDNLNTMLDHIDHIVKVIGVDHVGICTDGCFTPDHAPETFGLRGYENPRFDTNRWWGIWRKNPHTPKNPDESSSGSLAWSNWPLFTVGLVCRGYSDEKIHGQNFLRVMRANGCEA